MSDEKKNLVFKVKGQVIQPLSHASILMQADGNVFILKSEYDKLKTENEKLKTALLKTKDEYWNRCYDGSGTVKALTVQQFDALVDEALKESK